MKKYLGGILALFLVGGLVQAAPLAPKASEEKSMTRQERIQQKAAKIMERLETATMNQEKLLTRVNNRITKLETAGKDLTAVKTSAATAAESVKTAQASLETLRTSLTTLTTATTPLKIMTEAKEQIRATVEKIRAAHQSIVATISSLKNY